VFEAMVARISEFLNLFPFPSMNASVERHRIYAGQTSEHFAIRSLKFENIVVDPNDTGLLPVLPEAHLCLVPAGKCPVG
jgi:hypothetical protein